MDFVRATLWISAVFNFCAAYLFAFPSSSFAQLAGLPTPVPPVYTALTALFVSLFAGMYMWMALQPRVDRAWLTFGAVGKCSAFVVALTLWLAGDASQRLVLLACGDLFLGAYWARWLVWGGESAGNAV